MMALQVVFTEIISQTEQMFLHKSMVILNTTNHANVIKVAEDDIAFKLAI